MILIKLYSFLSILNKKEFTITSATLNFSNGNKIPLRIEDNSICWR